MPFPDRYRDFIAALRGPRVEQELAEEFEEHIARRTDELIAGGMAPADARREATRRFGDVARYRSETRAIDERIVRGTRRTESLDAFRRETKLAVRALARSRGFSAIAIITLALGLGATTAIFTLLDRVVLSPLSYPDAGRLVSLSSAVPGIGPDTRWGVSKAGFVDFQRNSRAFDAIGALGSGDLSLFADGRSERVRAAWVSASLLTVLGARPALGRLLVADDNRPGRGDSSRVVVLGYDFWRRRFASDPHVIGSRLLFDMTPMEVVGVLEPGVQLPAEQVDVWEPMTISESGPFYNEHSLRVIGRLKADVTVAAAEADLARLTSGLTEMYPKVYPVSFMTSTHFRTLVTPLRDEVVGGIARVLWVLLGAVGLVLAIACANVANLFLVRADARRRELAVRSALGAERRHLVWHYLTESIILSSVAGALGVALAYGILKLVLALAPAAFPRLSEIQLGLPSIVFALVVSLAAGVVFGLFPVIGSREVDVATLRESGRGVLSSRRQRAARAALVVGQMALALVLLATAGLMLQSVERLRAVRPGFEPTDVLAIEMSLPSTRYRTYETVETFDRELASRIAALPGVQSVANGTDVPLVDFGGCASVFVEDYAAADRHDTPCVSTPLVTPGYFRTLGIKVSGRAPDWSDVESRSGNSVVVTRALAERLWPRENPIGKGIVPNGKGPPYFRVVGVTDDLRGTALDKPPVQAIFFPTIPATGTVLWSPPRDMTLFVRARAGQSPSLVAMIRREINAMDPTVTIGDVQSMETIVSHSMARTSFAMMLLALAAGMAVALSAVGIYGVISYIVAQRRAEIGVRMALGARAAQVSRLIVGQSVRLAAVGVAIGLAATLAASRLLRSLLFDISPNDPLTLGAVSLLLLAIAAMASYAPARRAAGIDPTETLRG